MQANTHAEWTILSSPVRRLRVVFRAMLVLFVAIGGITTTVVSTHAQLAVAPPVTQLLGIGAVGDGQLGYAVSINAAGNVAIVGAQCDNGFMGAAYLFECSNTQWTQQGTKITPAGGAPKDFFGGSVSVDGDGVTAIVGAPGDKSFVGAAYVYARTDGVWMQQGATLRPARDRIHGQFGKSVAISGDGKTALIGAYADNAGIGAAYVYVLSSGADWTQQGPKIVPSGSLPGGRFGQAVSLSNDGNTALIGADSESGQIGAAYVFVRSGTSWSQQGPKLVPGAAATKGSFGYSVALSADGNTAAVGAISDHDYVGAAYIFRRSGIVWNLESSTPIRSSEASADRFGSSVSLTRDGNAVLIGAMGNNNFTGAAYLFIRSISGWQQHGAKLVPPGGVGRSEFGASLSLGANGSTACIGAFMQNSGVGATYFSLIDLPVSFITQPVPANAVTGGTAVFTVSVSFRSQLKYQWRRNGAPISDGPTDTGAVISGAITPSITIKTVSPADCGAAFDCVVTDHYGPLRSDPAGLCVTPNQPATGVHQKP